MGNVSKFSIGAVHEFIISAATAGFTPKELSVLTRSQKLLKEMLDVISGHASINQIVDIVDYDRFPDVPIGNWRERKWAVESHNLFGKFEWKPEYTWLYHDSPENGIQHQTCGDILESDFETSFPNASLMDHLLEHGPSRIPDDWQGKNVFFFGTIYRDRSDDCLYVRYLAWEQSRNCHCSGRRKLDEKWTKNDHALMFRGTDW